MTILQNTNYQLLMAGISRVTELVNGWFFQSPEVVAGDAANPRQYFDFFTPGIYYHVTAGLAPGATYLLTGQLGGATEHFSISTEAITAATAQTKDTLELGDNLVVNPGGSFTVVIGPTDVGGAVNYIDDTNATTGGAASLLIRDMPATGPKVRATSASTAFRTAHRSSPFRHRACSAVTVGPPPRSPRWRDRTARSTRSTR